MAESDLDERLKRLERGDTDMSFYAHWPAPPIMSEANRMLAEAKQRREAELRQIREAAEAHAKLEREREELRQYEEWLSHEPEREAARAELLEVRSQLAEAEREAAPFNRRVSDLESRIRELNAIALS